MKNSLTVIRW